MLSSVAHPAPYPALVVGLADEDAGRARGRRRVDGLDMYLRRLVDSSEPAVVFTSLVRLCVPAFSDACAVDIVEGGRVRYRIGDPPRVPGPTSALPYAERSVVTEFASDLPGWAPYTGVMTSLWHARGSTAEDEDRAAAIVEAAVAMIRRERLADPVRSSRALSALARQRRAQY